MILLPSLGPLHILHPRYNAATVLAILEAANPPVVYLASHSEASLAEGTWREEDPLLFHLLPWAEARGVPVVPVDREAHLKGEAEAFREALERGYLEQKGSWQGHPLFGLTDHGRQRLRKGARGKEAR